MDEGQRGLASWFTVGQITALRGFKGEVKVRVTTDFPTDRFRAGNRLYGLPKEEKAGNPVSLTVIRAWPYRAGWVVQFAEWEEEAAARPFLKARLVVPSTDRIPLATGEYYHCDIIGCRVATTCGRTMGRVVAVRSLPAQDLWVVREADGQEWLLPYVGALVKRVDLLQRLITIDWLVGLHE